MLACVLMASPAIAQDLYVNNSGSPACSDATAKASNSAASPWCTIQRAAKGATFGGGTNSGEAAAAGDTVHITCGLYEATASDTSFYVALNPVNEGSSGNPIRFQAVDNAANCIRVTPEGSSGPGGSPIGSVDRDYIEWSGFTLNETDWPWDDTGGCCAFQNGLTLFHGTEGNGTIFGGIIERSTLTGTYVDGRDGDNYTGIRIQGASATIQNNTIQDFGQAGHNNSCTTWYFGVSMVVQHNILQRCGAGIYAKNNADLAAGTSQHIIRYNYIAPNSVGIYCFQNCNGTALLPILIYQNIINFDVEGLCTTDACWAFVIGGQGNVQDPSHVHVVNNTTFGQNPNSESAFLFMQAQQANVAHKIYNNISQDTFFGVSGAVAGDIATTTIQFEHTIFYQATTWATWTGIGTINLATWRTTYTQDDTAPDGSESDPLFVTAGSDFHLQGGSFALTQGRVIDSIGGVDGATIPAGAYITGDECIGVDLDGDCQDPPPPAAAGPIRIRTVGL